MRLGIYRPFQKQHVYVDAVLNEVRSQLPKVFPTAKHANVGFYINGVHSAMVPAFLMIDAIPCLDLFGKGGQFFPRWTYVAADLAAGAPGELFEPDSDPEAAPVDGFRRVDNITDGTLADYREALGHAVTKDEIFYYAYGVLHSPQYRESFAADLRKVRPRIPKASSLNVFRAFAQAGFDLADLHLHYETVPQYPLDEGGTAASGVDPYDVYRVEKMRFATKGDRSTLIYNQHLTLAGIPDDAYRYQLGSRSAIEWIVDRYRVTTHKESGIVNDPNDWSREQRNPRYIVDLLGSIVTVSLETMKIVDALPDLPLDDG